MAFAHLLDNSMDNNTLQQVLDNFLIVKNFIYPLKSFIEMPRKCQNCASGTFLIIRMERKQ